MFRRSTGVASVLVALLLIAPGCGESEIENQNQETPDPTENQNQEENQNQDPNDGWDQDFLQVAQIMRATCAVGGCHGEPSSASTDLGFGANMDELTLEAIIDVFDSYEGGQGPLVDPGNPEGSSLYVTLTLDDPVLRMPQAPLNPLPEAQIELVRAWIEAGANYE